MKIKIINYIKKLFKAAANMEKFANIAEGTHAGSITIAAAEDINSAHLLVSLDNTGGAVEICDADTLPIGVCLDECADGEKVAVALPGCGQSTIMCVASGSISAGNAVFTDDDGKVTASKSGACFKVGIALNAASANGLVEVSPQGFGTRASEIAESGVYTWKAATTTETIDVDGATTGDFAMATIAAAGGSETAVTTEVLAGKIKFTLDAAGTASTTKINWLLIRK